MHGRAGGRACGAGDGREVAGAEQAGERPACLAPVRLLWDRRCPLTGRERPAACMPPPAPAPSRIPPLSQDAGPSRPAPHLARQRLEEGGGAHDGEGDVARALQLLLKCQLGLLELQQRALQGGGGARGGWAEPAETWLRAARSPHAGGEQRRLGGARGWRAPQQHHFAPALQILHLPASPARRWQRAAQSARRPRCVPPRAR